MILEKHVLLQASLLVLNGQFAENAVKRAAPGERNNNAFKSQNLPGQIALSERAF